MIINKIFHILQVGDIAENCIIAKCPETSKAIIFDPGDDHDKIIKYLNSIDADPELIVNTHGHHDHIGAISELKQKFNIPFWVHKAEEEYLLDPYKNYSALSGKPVKIKPDKLLTEKDIIQVGTLNFKILHTPGHTLGGCCFLDNNVLIAGDTLFAGSIGRCDLYGGSEKQIIRSIKNKILPLDDSIIILPGHGRHTTLKDEKIFNPFLQ
ncbi:MAG: MBL fold metallo-hydrolase [Candidatus Delongbacteria bacterium]|jgi:hydroxyacylglutathione hydrolase|nr:MBL fold metallo-hydrolase [Candidatus Delongbacteria bacterium]